MVDDYSSKSFRLLAMAVGIIPNVGSLDLHNMTQQQIEAEAVDMELLALVILTNPVRPDSKPTITQLQEGYAFPTFALQHSVLHTKVCSAQHKSTCNVVL